MPYCTKEILIEADMLPINPVTAVFILLSCLGLFLSDMRPIFVLNEVIIRFIRDGVMVMALIIPITAGMGLNFAIVVGAMCAQVGLILAVDFSVTGFTGLLMISAIGIALSLLMGTLIGLCLNRVKGREMIATIVIGFLATSIYQLVFMVGYGTLIHPGNQEMMLSRGIGIRNMIDLQGFRNILDNLWLVDLQEIQLPIFMILLVLTFAGIVQYISQTSLGQQFLAVGLDGRKAEMVGINVDHVRIKAIVLSTVLACCGHIIYIQNIGMLNVYTAHLNSDIFSCAALLAGGATIFRAKITHALIGVLLFHTLFIVSPQAGQNVFGNPALGEYFRSFIAYGTIAFALMMNMHATTRQE
jgi:simple sugar transport system permease protein